MGLPEAGFHPRQCLAFDLAVSAFGNRFEQAMAETKEVPMPKRGKSNPTMSVPKHDLDTLNRFLGLDEAGEATGTATDAELERLVSSILSGEGEWVE